MVVRVVFLADTRQQVDAVVDAHADADAGHQQGVDVQADADQVHAGSENEVRQVHRDQQDQPGDDRTVRQAAAEQDDQVQAADDDPVESVDHVVHCLLQRDGASAEPHSELVMVRPHHSHRCARSRERSVDGFLLVVLVPERDGGVLLVEVDDVGERLRTGAHGHGGGGGVGGSVVRVQRQPFRVAAGEQAVAFHQVVAEGQSRPGRCGTLLHQALQPEHSHDRVGLAGDALRVVLVLGLEHDLQGVDAREVRVDLRHRAVVFGDRPQQIAAFHRIADTDLQRGIDRSHQQHHHHRRRHRCGLAERQLGDVAQSPLKAAIQRTALASLADQAVDVVRRRQRGQ